MPPTPTEAKVNSPRKLEQPPAQHPQPAPQPEPAHEGPALPKWRVTLPGCPVRVVDPERGVATMQPHLDVEAASSADAFERFCRYNGIRSTNQQPKIERLPG